MVIHSSKMDTAKEFYPMFEDNFDEFMELYGDLTLAIDCDKDINSLSFESCDKLKFQQLSETTEAKNMLISPSALMDKDYCPPTPPASPRPSGYKLYMGERDWSNIVNLPSSNGTSSSYYDSMDDQSVISHKDCMWSTPGLTETGLNITEIKKLCYVDTKEFTAVSPDAVFPNIRVTPQLQSSAVPATSPLPKTPLWPAYDTTLDTPSETSEDDEEIDVVNDVEDETPQRKVNRMQPALKANQYECKINSKRPTTLSLRITTTSKPALSNTLPAAHSASAQVAAMHNYSSTTTQPKNQFKSSHSYSAPHTPSNNHHLASSSGKHSSRRPHPYSSPASPLNSSRNRRKAILNEEDLKDVARKLKADRRRNRRSANYRNSVNIMDDTDDNTEEGRRNYHNKLERKRRLEIKVRYGDLRAELPELADNEKAAKYIILCAAVKYIRGLHRTEVALDSELRKQQQIHERLRQKLSLLSRK